jgi:regulator of sirC expression with transglutaminase-like and TPR domain
LSAEKFDPYVSEWISFSKNPKHNLIEKSLKLAQILEYPDLNISKYIEKINEIGNSLKLKINNIKNPTYLMSMLNEHFFEKYGFTGDDEDYYDPRNNFLNTVIDKKSGIPITLSILYSEVARYVGLELRIVGFPGHVVVKYEEEMILDPFYRGRLLTIKDLEEILYTYLNM